MLSTSSRIPRADEVAYCSAKGGAEKCSLSTQLETEQLGIRVSTIYPGAMQTEFQMLAGLTPPKNPLPVADVADVILYAVSRPRYMRLNIDILRNPPKATC